MIYVVSQKRTRIWYDVQCWVLIFFFILLYNGEFIHCQFREFAGEEK